jgi:hypothetical protein
LICPGHIVLNNVFHSREYLLFYSTYLDRAWWHEITMLHMLIIPVKTSAGQKHFASKRDKKDRCTIVNPHKRDSDTCSKIKPINFFGKGDG